MKRILLFSLCITIVAGVISCHHKSIHCDVKNTVVELFVSTDNHQWNNLKKVFAHQVKLDYSSFTGKKATILKPDQIIKTWSAFLPKFKYTHHQVSNFKIKHLSSSKATVFCYGTATHFLPKQVKGNVWTVVGTYNFNLEKKRKLWKITMMKFNFKYQSGNTSLPRIAMSKK